MKIKTSIRLLLTFLVCAALTFPALAERGDDADRKSKNGKTEATIDGATVIIEYGRPKVRGRDVWGGIVPYDKVWRTGADEATTFTVDQDVMIEGKKLAAGTYSLFTVPGEESWEIVWNEVAEQWGAYEYDSGKDALRVEVTPHGLEEHVEEMDFIVDGSTVMLRWESLGVPFKVDAGS